MPVGWLHYVQYKKKTMKSGGIPDPYQVWIKSRAEAKKPKKDKED